MALVLVTGADGQLGSELRDLAAAGREGVTCVAAGGSGADEYIFTDAGELDVTDADAVWTHMDRNGAEVLVNCAAYTAVDRAEDEPEKADLLNREAVAGMAEVCAELDATMIHISTDFVFDGRSGRPYTEEDAAESQSVYGATKLAGERAIIESDCKHLILRTSWLYSAYGNNFVKTILRLSGERDSLRVVDDQSGTPTYAAGLAARIRQIIADRAYVGRDGLYHYSDAGECTWYDFAREIVRLSGNRCLIEPCTTAEYGAKAVRPAYSVLDKGKFLDTFGGTLTPWEENLVRCVKALNNNKYP